MATNVFKAAKLATPPGESTKYDLDLKPFSSNCTLLAIQNGVATFTIPRDISRISFGPVGFDFFVSDASVTLPSPGDQTQTSSIKQNPNGILLDTPAFGDEVLHITIPNSTETEYLNVEFFFLSPLIRHSNFLLLKTGGKLLLKSGGRLLLKDSD